MIGAPWLQGSSHSCTFHHVELISESHIKTKKKRLHQQIEVASISCKARAWLKWVNPNLSTVRFHLHLHSWRASSKTIRFDQLGNSVFPYFGRAYGYPSLTTACRGCLRRQMYLLGLYASQLSNDTPLGHLTGPNNLHQIGAAQIAAKSRREISFFSASASAFRPETPIAAALWVRSPHLALTGTQIPRVPRHIPWFVGQKSLPERSRDFQLRGHSASPWVPQNGSLRSTCVKCLTPQWILILVFFEYLSSWTLEFYFHHIEFSFHDVLTNIRDQKTMLWIFHPSWHRYRCHTGQFMKSAPNFVSSNTQTTVQHHSQLFIWFISWLFISELTWQGDGDVAGPWLFCFSQNVESRSWHAVRR